MGLEDSFGRKIEYLRLSVTDKCNMRCSYCMPQGGIKSLAHSEVLSFEEIERIVEVLAGLGVRKVRLTGGEPTVRKGFVRLIERIKQIPLIEQVAVTTNGLFDETLLQDMKAAGLSAINVSLDTFDERVFEKITGIAGAARVRHNIEKALDLGLLVKVNCVPLLDIPEQKPEEVALLAKDYPIDVRYIELMPIGCGRNHTGIKGDDMLSRLAQIYGSYMPLEADGVLAGPARYVYFQDFKGTCGFINPMSHAFCASCNRVRLTSDGFLKLCLHYDRGLDLKALLRAGETEEAIAAEIKSALLQKPKEHSFLQTVKGESVSEEEGRRMSQIGG